MNKEMTTLKRFDIYIAEYDNQGSKSSEIEREYGEGGDYVCAYEALDVVTVLEEKVVAKDAEIKRLLNLLAEVQQLVCAYQATQTSKKCIGRF